VIDPLRRFAEPPKYVRVKFRPNSSRTPAAGQPSQACTTTWREIFPPFSSTIAEQRIGKGKKSSLSLMDIKEAVKAAAPSYPGRTMLRNHARRVVEGARHLSPFLGEPNLSGRAASPLTIC
jgi:hypothetical protein